MYYFKYLKYKKKYLKLKGGGLGDNLNLDELRELQLKYNLYDTDFNIIRILFLYRKWLHSDQLTVFCYNIEIIFSKIKAICDQNKEPLETCKHKFSEDFDKIKKKLIGEDKESIKFKIISTAMWNLITELLPRYIGRKGNRHIYEDMDIKEYTELTEHIIKIFKNELKKNTDIITDIFLTINDRKRDEFKGHRYSKERIATFNKTIEQIKEKVLNNQ